MEAIDTVMSPEERIKFDKRFTTGSVNLKGLAEAQAEITAPIFFKAGEKQGIDKGRKEVVEWIESREVIPDVLGAVRFYASRKEWQAFLKKLGLLRQEMPK